MVQLRWWEIVIGTVLALVAIVWLAGGLWVAGIVLLLLLTFGVASRATVVERQVAGAHARTRGSLALIRMVALLAILIVVVVLGWLLDRRDWTEETLRVVASFALAGVAIYLMRDISRYADEAVDYFIGGRSERQVARELEPLRAEGWEIAHNIRRDERGNLDHFVSGPSGTFAIETKSGRYRAADRGQAISNAIWAKEKFGKRFVTAVLCVATDPPEQPREELHWVVGPEQLRDWLKTHRWVSRAKS